MEFAEAHENGGVGGIHFVEAEAFINAEVALPDTRVRNGLTPGETRGFHRALKVGGPHGREGRAVKLRSDRRSLFPTEVGQGRVAPAGDPACGVVRCFTMTHQPEFDDLVFHGE